MHFYDITIHDIHGNPLDLKSFTGKKILVVNVASECGYTRQYEGMESLYKDFSDRLVILGCPCNDFGGQEPGEEAEILTFCQKNYGVTFPLTEKINIQRNPHPLYQWLCQKSLNGVSDAEVTWNFQKFMINENGQWEACLAPSAEPFSPDILHWIDAGL